MPDGESAPIVLVAAREELLNKLRNALADTVGLLHAETHRDAITLLERLRSEIGLAIVELEHPDGWDLIEELTRTPKSLKVIATTSADPAPVLGEIMDLGIDALVPVTMAPEEWRKTVQAVLRHNELPE